MDRIIRWLGFMYGAGVERVELRRLVTTSTREDLCISMRLVGLISARIRALVMYQY